MMTPDKCSLERCTYSAPDRVCLGQASPSCGKTTMRLAFASSPGSRYKYVRMYVCTYVRMYVCTYVRTYVCTYVCMYVCTYVRMYVCTYVRMYVCTYVCMNSYYTLRDVRHVPMQSSSPTGPSHGVILRLSMHDAFSRGPQTAATNIDPPPGGLQACKGSQRLNLCMLTVYASAQQRRRRILKLASLCTANW